MSVQVETLEDLERRITLELSVESIRKEVDKRLKKLSRQVRIDGFRPGKVPLSMVSRQYGYSVQNDVLNDELGAAFNRAVQEAELRVAGSPRIEEREQDDESKWSFDAVFEVMPDITVGGLDTAEVEKVVADVNDDAIERTLDILRQQRRTFAQRKADAAVEAGDRVTVDFVGKIDGEEFEGGSASDFAFMVGEGQMLKEFDDAVRGMKSGESKTFPLDFPENYHGKDVAGKQADFMVSVTRVEASHLPEVTDEFARSLGVADATTEGLRADIRKNLENQVRFRVDSRNKAAALQVLTDSAQLQLPKVSVQSEVERMVAAAREDLKKSGIKDVESAPVPEDVFREEAERRVRMGLVVSEVVQQENLYATEEQVKKHIDSLAVSYEKPEEVTRWYYSDEARMNEVRAAVVEQNVADYVFSKAKVVEKNVSFEELMGQQQ